MENYLIRSDSMASFGLKCKLNKSWKSGNAKKNMHRLELQWEIAFFTNQLFPCKTIQLVFATFAVFSTLTYVSSLLLTKDYAGECFLTTVNAYVFSKNLLTLCVVYAFDCVRALSAW